MNIEICDKTRAPHIHTIFVITPASCRCGGDTAILKQRPSGAQEMIGCVCHTTIADLLAQR